MSLRLPSVYLKVERKMDPIFEHPVFDSAREKVKRAIRQLEKPPAAPENLLYTCFKCGSNKIFPSQNRLSLLMRERPYSMTAVIGTINGGVDDNNK